ncbi:MAG: hypothetical protein ACLRZ9_04980 [Eubacterium sp.]
MKKYIPIISSIITVLICIAGQSINQKMDYNAQMNFNGTENLIWKILILFCVGVCVGWNIWILCKDLKRNVTVILVSILLNVIVALIYFFLNRIFLYPVVLVGMYVFLLLRLLYCNNK